MRPLVGETMAYWPAKSRPPPGAPIMRSTITSTRRPGSSKAGQGSVPTSAPRRVSRAAARWRVRARRGLSAQSASLAGQLAGAGERGDLERIDVGGQADVGDDDAAAGEAARASGAAGWRQQVVGRATAGGEEQRRSARRRPGGGRRRIVISRRGPSWDAAPARWTRAVDRADGVADLGEDQERVAVDLAVRADRGEDGVGAGRDVVELGHERRQVLGGGGDGVGGAAGRGQGGVDVGDGAAVPKLGEGAAQFVERGGELGRDVGDAGAGEEGVGGGRARRLAEVTSWSSGSASMRWRQGGEVVDERRRCCETVVDVGGGDSRLGDHGLEARRSSWARASWSVIWRTEARVALTLSIAPPCGGRTRRRGAGKARSGARPGGW